MQSSENSLEEIQTLATQLRGGLRGQSLELRRKASTIANIAHRLRQNGRTIREHWCCPECDRRISHAPPDEICLCGGKLVWSYERHIEMTKPSEPLPQ